MKSEEWSRIEALFHDALERPESEQAAFLDSECGSDTTIREQVQSLITRAARGDVSFHQGVQQAAADAFHELRQKEMSGRRVGPYEVRTLLGAGGMGEVYLARDSKLARDVAIKVLP